MYRLTAVADRVVMTQDTTALCNMSLSSTNMSPLTPHNKVIIIELGKVKRIYKLIEFSISDWKCS